MKHLIETEGNKVTPRGNAARIAALRRAAKHYRVGQVIDYQGEQLLRVDARAKRQFWVYLPPGVTAHPFHRIRRINPGCSK